MKIIMVLIFIIITLLMPAFSVNGQKVSIDGKVSMLALGDSYTIGQSVSKAERWPHQFIDEIRAMGVEAEYPDYIATTGWTSNNLINGINSMLNGEKDYNLVSILIGVNNQYQGIPFSAYEPDLRKIIDTALYITGQDTSGIMILSIPDYAYTSFGGGDPDISREIDEYNEIKKKVADEYGIAFIDITPISRNGLANPSLVAPDGLHPSGTQYGLWVKEILPQLSFDLNVSAYGNSRKSQGLVSVYPNPSKGIIKINSSVDEGRIRIYSSAGIMIIDVKFNHVPFHIDLSDHAPGIYTLMLFNSANEIIESERIFHASF